MSVFSEFYLCDSCKRVTVSALCGCPTPTPVGPLTLMHNGPGNTAGGASGGDVVVERDAAHQALREVARRLSIPGGLHGPEQTARVLRWDGGVMDDRLHARVRELEAALQVTLDECESWMRVAGMDGADQPTAEDFARLKRARAVLAGASDA